MTENNATQAIAPEVSIGCATFKGKNASVTAYNKRQFHIEISLTIMANLQARQEVQPDLGAFWEGLLLIL